MMIVCLLPHRFDSESHAIFSFFSLCSCQDEFFDCVETNEDLKRLRSAADSEPKKASLPELKERLRLSPYGMTVFACIAIGNLAPWQDISVASTPSTRVPDRESLGHVCFKLLSYDPFPHFLRCPLAGI